MSGNLHDVLDQAQVDYIVKVWTNSVKYNKQLSSVIVSYNNKTFTLMDLLSLFTEESYKICKHKTIASMIALETTREYLTNHVDNVQVTY